MGKRILIVVASMLVGLVVVFLLGPRVKIDTTLSTVELPEDLDAYLAQSEAQYSDIVPGAEKTIVWAGEPGQKTPLSIIYLHGFSASRQEAAPLADNLATELGANLFYSRFTGHGRTGPALAEATVNDYLQDSQEALAIGRRLGERVIIIAVSTGSTAATWLATQPESADVLAFVLISPNYGPRDGSSEMLLLPWGEQLANIIIGPERSWEPHNEAHGTYWTHKYPTKAILPMMGLVKLVREADLEAVERPILMIYSPNDEVINTQKAEETYSRFGSEVKDIIAINEVGDPSNHVLVGDILSPNDTEPIGEMILSFIVSLSQ